MQTVITHDRIENYTRVLNDMLAAAEAQTRHPVRRPHRIVVEFLDAMSETCLMLQCQMTGGPRPKPHDIELIKQKVARMIASEGRRG